MQRQDFLRLSGLAAASLLLPGWRRPQPQRASVLVIGAGMAGAAAAHRLAQAGFYVRVLEARDRIGGRIHTHTDWGQPLELGAGWIHRGSPGSEVIAALAQQLGVATRRTRYPRVRVYDQSGRRHGALGAGLFYLGQFQPALRRQLAAVHAAAEDVALATVLERSFAGCALSHRQRVLREFIEEGFQNSLNTTFERASAQYYLDEKVIDSDGADDAVLGGYVNLVRHLLRGIDVRLRTPVREIAHDARGVTVRTDGETFTADYAVVTLPLSVLRAGDVRFDPVLPDWKRAAFARIGTGLFNKVILRFAAPFWPGRAEAFFFQSELKNAFGLTVNWHRHTGQPILMAMPVARAAEWVEERDPAAVRQRWEAILRRAFPRRDMQLEEMLVTRWGRDPYARGAYSYVPVGSTAADFRAIGAPVGRLQFAGEATAPGNNATVHGAYASGLRVAEALRSSPN